MAKLGKYSSGLGVSGPKNAPYVNSNGGYEKKQGLAFQERVKMVSGGTATGNAVPTVVGRPSNPRK